ncbi:hypothetical protein GQX73_g8294 [Xylaria multiplex]|uniref:Condensation domain-containing protein n=1 Tax=Xylaria multiplex TaxID=323545 RepID=A0A7C8MPT8_9PEZI|nr:hypothetical protein GQX73_g8294 [Xylaria multiplex]
MSSTTLSSTSIKGFSRPLGNLEGFFKSLSDSGKPLNREHWVIHFVLSLKFPPFVTDPIPHLQYAWEILRLRHPTLGAILQEPESNNSRGSLSVGPLNIREWTDNTFIVCPEYADADQLFSTLYPTPTATCYWLPTSCEFVIRSSHWRIDGVGMASLGHEFMTTLAKVVTTNAGAPARDLFLTELLSSPSSVPPSLEDLAIAQSHSKSGEGDPILEAGADELVSIFLRGVPSIGLPTRDPSTAGTVPGPSARVMTSLDVEKTTQVSAACRKMDIKVTSAVHAAIVRVTARFPQHPLCKSYAAFVPVDLRRALDKTATTHTKNVSKVVGLYFSGLPLCVENVFTKSFEEVAQDLATVYGRDLSRFWSPRPSAETQTGDLEGKTIGLLDLAEPYVRRTTALFNSPVPEGLPPVQTPDLSSLGRMESSIKKEYADESNDPNGNRKVEVIDFWVGTEMLTRNVQFHVWSWDGSLRLGASFNTSFYDKGFVAEVMQGVIAELLDGCGIGNGSV